MAWGVLQWIGIVIEVIGLFLIAVELYFPVLSEHVKVFFERIQFRFTRKTGTRQTWNWIAITSYILIWVISVTIVSIHDPAKSVVANVAFTIIAMFLGTAILISRVFVRLGVAIGRGNVIGGVGLVLALTGFAIEISQMLI